jgi:hypothetical protein
VCVPACLSTRLRACPPAHVQSHDIWRVFIKLSWNEATGEIAYYPEFLPESVNDLK